MKKFLLVIFLLSVGFGTEAFAETGKNMNWCNTSQKTKSPLYLTNIGGKIKR